MLRQAASHLYTGASVVLDATFSRERWRRQAQALAQDTGALFLCVECRAGEQETRRRLLAREQDAGAVSDATWEIYLAQRASFEPVIELSDWEHIVLDATGPVPEVSARARALLEERLHPAPIDPTETS
jgi:predicted kinase